LDLLLVYDVRMSLPRHYEWQSTNAFSTEGATNARH
jgi:hypothetical protein